MNGLLEKNLVRESIIMRIKDKKNDLNLYDGNSLVVLHVEGEIIALESLLSSLDKGNFDWKGDK